MIKLDGNLAAWIRTAVIVVSCGAALVYGYSTTVGDLRVVRQRVVNIERETDAGRAEYRLLAAKIDEKYECTLQRLRALEREVARNSAKLDLLLRKDET